MSVLRIHVISQFGGWLVYFAKSNPTPLTLRLTNIHTNINIFS